MKILNKILDPLFAQKSKTIKGVPNETNASTAEEVYYTAEENFKEDLKFFKEYKRKLEEEHSAVEIDAFLLITQAIFAYHPFDIRKVRDLEINLSQDNVEAYEQEKINLDKIHRLFFFFATTRTHEIKNKYGEWMKEYYKKHKTPIFRTGERSRYVPDGWFIEFVYEKILEEQKY